MVTPRSLAYCTLSISFPSIINLGTVLLNSGSCITLISIYFDLSELIFPSLCSVHLAAVSTECCRTDSLFLWHISNNVLPSTYANRKVQSTFEYEVGFPTHALLQCVYGRTHILVSLFPWHSACSLSFHVVYPSTTILVISHRSRDLCKYVQTTIVYVCEHAYHLYCITINLEGGLRYKPPVVSREYH